MIKVLIYFIFGLSFCSCEHTITREDSYPKEPSFSSKDGTPKDSLSFYLPAVMRVDTGVCDVELDTFRENWFSSALYSAQERILFNYYLGHDIYRFLWLRSFHRPVIISLNRKGNRFWLTTKELNKQPNFMDLSYVKIVDPATLPNTEIDSAYVYGNGLAFDSISKADRKASIILNETKPLSEKEWQEFEEILNSFSFWTAKPYIESFGVDGSEWTIEGHLKGKYWFVNRWSPKDNFRKAGEYLIKKSGLKEEIY
ncbi:MAG: hypothetical protein ABI169_16675 [Chitinophagaceae bacterium]